MLALFSCSALAAGENPCTAEAYRQFDFWRGHWEVAAGGKPAGHNRITSEHNGCLLSERWKSVQGGTGSSMNFYDPARGQWRQVWVSAGTIIDIAGGLDAGSMVLEGTITDLASGEQLPFKGVWTPLEDGRVRQFFEEYRDAGWKPWFEGFYTKVLE